MSVPWLRPTPASSFTEWSGIICDPLHHAVGTHAPSIVVFAPGKPAKILSKLRFSWTKTTTCLIFPLGPPLGGGTTVLEPLQPATQSAAASATAPRRSIYSGTPPACSISCLTALGFVSWLLQAIAFGRGRGMNRFAG